MNHDFCRQNLQLSPDCTVADLKFNTPRVPTSAGSHGKPGKTLKKSSMHGKIMEFEKNLKNHGKIMEFCEIICRNHQ